MKKLNKADKLYKLIRIAVADLEKVEKNPKFTINMSEWHFKESGKCIVCFAGSVMSQTCKLTPGSLNVSAWAGVDPDDENKLMALNDVRTGDIKSALGYFYMYDDKMGDKIRGIEIPDSLQHPVEYNDDPTLFKKQMLEIADWLEKQ